MGEAQASTSLMTPLGPPRPWRPWTLLSIISIPLSISTTSPFTRSARVGIEIENHGLHGLHDRRSNRPSTNSHRHGSCGENTERDAAPSSATPLDKS